MSALKTRSNRAKARSGTAACKVIDRSPWEWYAPDCPCGLPPGHCREHPRARDTQRPPDGDWRVWATWPVAGPARRGPGLRGSRSGSKTAR